MAKTQSRRERRRADRFTPVRLCPRCGAEYLAHVDTCTDCRVALFDPAADAGPLAPEAEMCMVFETTDPPHAQFVAACLQRAGIPFERKESVLISERLISFLVEEARAPEAFRIVGVVEGDDGARTPEAVVDRAQALPLRPLTEDLLEDIDGLDVFEEDHEAPPLAPAESAHALLTHLGAGVLWFLALLSFTFTQDRHALWWAAVVACVVAALACSLRRKR